MADTYLETKLHMGIFSFVASVGDISMPENVIKEIVDSPFGRYSKEKIDEMGTIRIHQHLDSKELVYEN